MKLYLDDDSVATLLVRLLRKAGHDVEIPADIGLSRREDPVHLRHCIKVGRVCLSHNHKDYDHLHELILEAHGHHPGIFIVRKDNDPRRDLDAPGIVRAIGKLLAAGVAVGDQLHILNQWR
jgi:hypothetical protein